MKLKTLKDFESHVNESIHNRLCKELKKEAIKWVKSFESLLRFAKHEGYKQENLAGKIGFIKEFFNITEEDLK